MVPNISKRKGIHKNNMRFFMLPSPKYVANFRLRNRFFRGERWIHTGRKWAPSSAPLAEKLPGGETGRETGWIFLFFCLLYIVSTFYILHLCILHSSLIQKTFSKNASCKKHSSLMHSAFFTDAFCISEECMRHYIRYMCTMSHVSWIVSWLLYNYTLLLLLFQS